MNKNSLILWCILLVWTLYHASFFTLNEVLKVADSFAYFQMSHFLQQFSQEWLGNGWFGFIYSLPLSIVSPLFQNELFIWQVVNLWLFNLSAILLWKISRKVLSLHFSFLTIILFFLSPTLLHFNIHILSENIYIPLFLGLFLVSHKLTTNITNLSTPAKYASVISIACLIGLMYLTRAEAFIYILSIGILSSFMLYEKLLSLKEFLCLGLVFFVSFFVLISPYLFHLHSLSGEWGLTNKWASNLRQAELRGQYHLDDDGFERAVGELTDDKHHLIAGFAGWLPYHKPSIEWSLMHFIAKDPWGFISRIAINQKKLYTRNLPEIFLGKSPKLYHSDDSRFSHIFFLIWVLIPLGVLLFWISKIYTKQKEFFILSLSFFIPAGIFFTLFFTLNRYFLIFYPLMLIIFCYGVQSISYKNISKYIQIFCIINLISILLLSTFVYANTEKPKDEYYSLKKEAWEWLYNQSLNPETIKIMERFPIVTYYSGSKIRYITPYTPKISDVYEYGKYHGIDFLVVDTMDFQTYRPALVEYLEKTPENFTKLKEFSNTKWQKVILYQLQK